MYTDNKLPLVYYGAGTGCLEELDWIDAWKNERPEVYGGTLICDSDVKKQGTFIRGIPVVSLDEARTRYGDFNIYLTVREGIRHTVSKYLLKQGIEKRCILNFVEQEKFYGCDYLNSWLNFTGSKLSPCCSPPLFGVKPPMALVSKQFLQDGNYDLTLLINEYIGQRDSFVSAIRNNEKNTCQGCPALKDKSWTIEKAFTYIGFILDGPCNLRCNYCMCQYEPQRDNEAQKYNNDFDFRGAINLMVKQGMITRKTLINLATGDITVNKKADEILDAVERCYGISVPTNAVVFNERVAKLCSRPGKDITVSIDAGTANTFQTIKGVDAFSKVVKNLEDYSQRGTNIVARYIFLPENSNITDVGGFVDIVKSLNVKLTVITCDVYRKQAFSDEQIELVRRMKYMLEENNITAVITKDLLTKEEVDKIG